MVAAACGSIPAQAIAAGGSPVGWSSARSRSHLMVGGEVFHETASASGGRGETGFNLGGACDLSAHAHLIGSAGRQLQGVAQTTFYGALQLTL